MPAFLDQPPGRQQFLAAQRPALVGTLKNLLQPCVVVAGLHDRDRGSQRNAPCFHGCNQPVLALGKQLQDAANPCLFQRRLARDRRQIVAPLLELPDRLQQLPRPRIASGDVLDQTHHKGVLVAGVHHQRRYRLLPECLKRLDAALPAHQHISLFPPLAARRARDRLLEPKRPDRRHHLLEDFLVALARVQDLDPVERNFADGTFLVHAALRTLARSAM